MTSRNSMREFADRAERKTGARFGGPLPSDKDRAGHMANRLSGSDRKSDKELRGRLENIKGWK